MKLITWNVNGIRSLKKTISSVLEDFDSDIICFQETKISRSQLPENIALINGYTSYFSYPRKQSGYSGVASYCKDCCMPDYAEETLSVDNEFSIDEEHLNILNNIEDSSDIDFEGRVMITRHLIKHENKIRKLVVINVYCPRVDPEKPERHFYKMKFCYLLQSKLYEFCQQECFVVIVGDLNISCSVIDHCDPGDEEEFNASEARQWLKSFFTSEVKINKENIKSVDAFRHFYPDKKEAYTCWNTKTGARLTNYGTRIDYVIVSSNLIPLLSSCEILSEYQGSDHCPITAEIKCDFVPELSVQLPSICTRLWPEFSGQQQNLKSLFLKVQQNTSTIYKKPELKIISKSKVSKAKNKQKSITSFFGDKLSDCQNSKNGNPNHSNRNREFEIDTSKDNSDLTNSDESCKQNNTQSNSSDLILTNSQEEKAASNAKSNEWRVLLSGPPKPPLCRHNKPCVLRTVKKSGPNLGRQFFMCAQPAGSSSNPEANCNFFKWATASKVKS